MAKRRGDGASRTTTTTTAAAATRTTAMRAPEGGGAGTATDASRTDDGFDVDALFGAAKAKKRARVADAVTSASRTEERIRVLLPGEKRRKQKRTTAEFTPVDKPRRTEDGLPVFKSYDDFTDMKAGQDGGGVDERGRKLGPNGEPGGECPFDCWCCF